MASPEGRARFSERIDASAVTGLADLAATLRGLRRREARLRHGRELTYHQLAARTGWSVTIIGAYLNGAVLPPSDRFDTLVLLLGAGVDELGPLASARDRVADTRRHERVAESAVSPWPPPRQLPAPPTRFVGRDIELARLDAVALDGVGSEAPGAVVTGMAGVGKTALALHWAHRVADMFPDGQLYVDLRGFDPNDPVDPADALAGFLRSFNPGQRELPLDVSERVAHYRALLSGRRVLVLLDNASSAQQVRPLLPGSPLCTVLITSRDSLPGLIATDGVSGVALDLLPAEHATELLRGLIGDRVDATPDAAASLAAACGRLPLAIRIAAEAASRHVAVPLQDLVDDLSNEATRLDTLDTGESRSAARTVFSWSYRVLSPAAAGLFRLLGLAPASHLTVNSIASLGGLGSIAVRETITELNRANLLVESMPGQYVLHDVLRVYAAELADSDVEPPDRDTALRRLLDHYLHTAIQADRLLDPDRWPLDLAPPSDGTIIEPIDSTDAALRWFAAEQAVQVAAVRLAARLGYADHAWQLTWAMATYLDRTGLWREMAVVNAIALAAVANPAAAGRVHGLSARASLRLGLVDTALGHYRQASALFEQLGDEVNLASTHSALGKCYSESGALREAVAHHRRALELFRRHGNRVGQAASLNNVGFNLARLGDHPEALEAAREALTLARELGNGKGEAHCLDSLAYILRGMGQHDQAIEHYHEAVALFEQSGARLAQTDAWISLGDTYAEADQPDAAQDAWRLALEILEDLDHPGAAAVRLRLAPALRTDVSRLVNSFDEACLRHET